MKTILVATDFSPAALNATNYATDMAAAIEADILLLHIFQVPVVYTEIPLAINPEDLMKDAEEKMLQLKKQLNMRPGNKPVVNTEVREGVFFHELKTVCERIMPYAVVLGSQGTSATERLLFGGHTIYAMKNLQWPIITVPAEASYSSVKKIGLCCDFDNVAGFIPFDEIKMLVTDFNAELQVLNTGKQNVFDPDIVFQSGLLQEILGGLQPKYHFITNKNTDEGIINFAEDNQIDLLVVFPKRHDLLDKLIHTSLTKKLVLHSHVPVMALHH